jgi:hypothetical protein
MVCMHPVTCWVCAHKKVSTPVITFYMYLLWLRYTQVKISHPVVSLPTSHQQVVLALLVPICQQDWDKLLTICNDLVDIIRPVARFFRQVRYSHEITYNNIVTWCWKMLDNISLQEIFLHHAGILSSYILEVMFTTWAAVLYWKYKQTRLIVWVHWRTNFKNKHSALSGIRYKFAGYLPDSTVRFFTRSMKRKSLLGV